MEGAVFEIDENDTSRRATCPECRYSMEQKSGRSSIIGVVVAGVLLGLISMARPGSGTAMLGLNACAGWAMMILTILPHEVAHALMARWLGLGNGRIHAGNGPLILHGRFLGFPLLWRAIPLRGFLEFGTPVRRVTLTRLFLVYAAGPGSHLLMALATWTLMGRPEWSEFNPMRRFEPGWVFIAINLIQFFLNLHPAWERGTNRAVISDGLALLQIVFLQKEPFIPQWEPERRFPKGLFPAVVIVATFLLWKTMSSFKFTGAGKVDPWFYLSCFVVCLSAITFIERLRNQLPGNQGGDLHRQLDVKAMRQKAAEYHRIGEEAIKALEMMLAGNDRANNLERFEQLAAHHGDSFLPDLLLAGEHTSRGNWSLAKSFFERCLSRELSPEIHATTFLHWVTAAMNVEGLVAESVRGRLAAFCSLNPPPLPLCCVLDALATRVLEAGDPELLNDADRWSAETLTLAPGEITLAGTRGSLLIENGRIEEGEAMLREVVARSASDLDQGIASLYLAIAAKRRGAETEAAALAEHSRALLPAGSGFCRRLQEEFPEQ